MKTSNITFKLTDSEKEAIKALAAKKDVPMSQLIREAIKLYIQEAQGNVNNSCKPEDN